MSNKYTRVKKGSSYWIRVETIGGRRFHVMRHKTEKFFHSAVEILKELEREERLRAFNVGNLKKLDEIGYFETK